MKAKLLIVLLFVLFVVNSFGQNNPVENLTWSQTYETPNNYFQLNWEEPLQPHNPLLGYNIYRNDELFRFQTERALYNFYSPVYGFVSNCGLSFLELDNQNQLYTDGFEIHVTAVYDPGQMESNYTQTYHANPLALQNTSFTQEKMILFPNPTKGLVTIGNLDFEKIMISDISGKVIKTLDASPQIDLSDLSKGLYIIKLFSEQKILVDKILIE
ncbi:T9SS type A sorting domain-containing protein [Flavobacterium sp. N1994]|uniref:T9SS type A sorting domain-containing protein n=1 Tax=Flavobacterium sp. N1994 TaxID=2986827 RepID=UPI002222B383|nr:T9SS type A sorting domain-containing protein [Flavobacterium sp. N1994]